MKKIYFKWKPIINNDYVISTGIISPWGPCVWPVTCKKVTTFLFWNLVTWVKRLLYENEIL